MSKGYDSYVKVSYWSLPFKRVGERLFTTSLKKLKVKCYLKDPPNLYLILKQSESPPVPNTWMEYCLLHTANLFVLETPMDVRAVQQRLSRKYLMQEISVHRKKIRNQLTQFPFITAITDKNLGHHFRIISDKSHR